MTALEVLSAGAMTTIQDLGRPGLAHLGVPRSGAADTDALRAGNRLVGNEDGAPALETTLVGPRLRAVGSVVVALTGAPVSATTTADTVPMYEPFELGDGETLTIGTARTGLRTYIAVRGGIEAPLTFGSAATDLLTGLGPQPLASGQRLRAGTPVVAPAPGDQHPPLFEPEPVLRVIPGPRADWLTEAAQALLRGEPFVVTPESNRVGLRLRGPELEWAREDQLLSEGITPGSLQVPPSGQPILLLADHPTTGGYPVIAVLATEELSRAGQLRPGQTVRFTTAMHS